MVLRFEADTKFRPEQKSSVTAGPKILLLASTNVAETMEPWVMELSVVPEIVKKLL